MCFDSLNSSDIACGEYASRTLAGKQAPSMAVVFAIDGARNSNSLWRAYLPEATFLRIRNTYFYP